MRAAVRLLLGAALLALVAPVARGQDEPLGRTAAFGPLDSGRTVTVPAGTPLRSRPDPEAAVLIAVDMEVELQVLETRGDWVRAAFGDWIGWLAPGGEARAARAPLPEIRVSQMVLDTSPAEAAVKVANARELLEHENTAVTALGPWPLHTDVRDAGLLALLDTVASQLPSIYGERFGLPVARPAEPVPIVLYSSEAQYRRFTKHFTEIAELHGGGHADSAMAALFVGDSSDSAVAATLVHELTHLLNRETFGQAPATWLEEGMANDLGFARIDGEGRLEMSTLGGDTSVSSQRMPGRRLIVNAMQTGGQAMLTQLLRDWSEKRSQLTRLIELLDLPWSEFVAGSQRRSNYALSTFFVRYLLDVAAAEQADAFRRFIAEAARGAPSGAVALAQALETSPGALERDYERWLTVQSLNAR